MAGWKGRQNHKMNTYVIATVKSWNIENSIKFISRNPRDVFRLVTEKSELTEEMLREVRPRYIFFPHWSWMIPECIYERYECVVFHMTDLPFGRGGSPLQNLIIRGFNKTKISAIKVQTEIDAGPVYMKEDVSLEGNATEIFERISKIVFEKMIPCFFKEELEPVEQQGKPEYFKLRTLEESELNADMKISEIYNYIRMLDAEGYSNAFLNFGRYKLSFKNAKLCNGEILAEVRIAEGKNECDIGCSSSSR